MDIPTKKHSNNIRKKAINHIKIKTMTNVALLIIFFLLFSFTAFVIYLNSTQMSESSPAFMKKAYEMNSKIFKKEGKIAATVNKDPISIEELEKRYTIIPPEYRPYITKDDLLKQMVDEKILLQEAGRKGITVSDETVTQYITNLSIQAQTTMEEFENILKQNGLTLTDAKDFYKKSLVLNELLSKEVFKGLTVQEGDMKLYYDENKALFTTPESLNVSHILICHNNSQRCTSVLTEEEALDKANSIRSIKKDFGELALEYSDEPAAKMTKGNLGWLNAESPMDQTFLNATFNLKVGEISSPIKTVFGYHLIKVWEIKKAEVLSYDVVKEQIYQTLYGEMQKTELMNYISSLRNQSNVIYFKIE